MNARERRMRTSAMGTRYKKLRSKLTGELKSDLYFINDDRKRAWTSYHLTKDAIISQLSEHMYRAPRPRDDATSKAVSKGIIDALQLNVKRAEMSCSVCYKKMFENLSMTRCSHLFHSGCLTLCSETEVKCPLCQAHLDPVGDVQKFD